MPYSDACEVIDLKLPTTTCNNLPNLPATVYGAIGGLLNKEIPIICGGNQNNIPTKSCYSLENNTWVSSITMNSVRAFAEAAQLQDGKLLVTGGYDVSTSALNSAEMLTEEGWRNNIPNLPVTIVEHCMVTVNSTTVMVIGGKQGGIISGNTIYFTLGEESWTLGPTLETKRAYHTCGRIRRDNDSQLTSIIVAGGHDGSSFLSSVEILDGGSNEWKTGPTLPLSILKSEMLEDHNGGVVMIGGFSPNLYVDKLYQLPFADQGSVWTRMQQKLKTGRERQTAMLVPDKIVDCISETRPVIGKL